jgi:diaminopimelate epimerase
MRFTKMHGLGNDYVYVDGAKHSIQDPAAVARRVADRHFGIGGDGLILVLPSDKADVRMRMFNADGSEGGMCGNGVRCVAKFAWDQGLSRSNPMRVETGRGVLSLALTIDDGAVSSARVDMDEPILELSQIPVVQGALGRNALYKRREGGLYALAYEIDGDHVEAAFVSMGNPHLVIFTPDVERIDLHRHGPALENYPAFPKRTNVHFAQVMSRSRLTMRTWERGSGITMACGTGACAVAVAAVNAGHCDRKVDVELPGGVLQIEWDAATNHVFMTGPATTVFEGEWPHD